jgi:hypothetical protein
VVLVIGVALGLILVGLVMMVLAPKAGSALLSTVVWWVGVVVLVLGLILLVTPVLVLISGVIRSALGT